MKDQYVIIDLRNMDYMKDGEGQIEFYDTFEDASLTCGMYEFEDAWICKLVSHRQDNAIQRTNV